MSPITLILIAVGITSVLIYRSGLLSGKTLSLPKFGKLPTAGPGTFKKIVLTILLIGLLAFVWIWWPETLIGSKIQTLINTHVGQEWVPYGMQYIPTALILWFMWNLIFGPPGGGMTIATVLIWGVGIVAVTVLILHFSTGGKGEATGKTIAAPDVVLDGEPAYITIRPVDKIKTFNPQPKVGRGDGRTDTRMCLKIVEPKIVTDRPEAQNFHFWMNEPEGRRQSNSAEFAPEVKKLLNENNFTEVKIKVTIKTMQLGTNPCRWTAWSGNFTKEAEADQLRP